MAEIFPIFEAGESKRGSVLFFHGLEGDPHTTWGAGKKGEIDEQFWPAWLKKDLEGLSVYSVGYSARISTLEGSSRHFFFEARKIFARLLNKPELQDGSLYLVGHSLGGLVIKQLIRTAESEAFGRSKAQQFLQRLEKIVFLATPHRGANLACWADRIPGFRELLSATTDDLDKGNPHLYDLHRWYRNWANSRKIPHLAMHETKPLDVADIMDNFGLRWLDKLTSDIGVMIVDKKSANPGIEPRNCSFIAAENCNHFEIAKPQSVDSQVYKSVREFLRDSIVSLGPRIAAQVQNSVQGALMAA